MSLDEEQPENEQAREVPLRALVLSVLALAVPVTAHVAFPDVVAGELGILVWLTALVPPFLLTYYRTWIGASVALAAGMAALSLTQVGVILAGAEPPPVSVLFFIVAVLIIVSLGAGWLAERLHSARREAESMALTDDLTGLANRRHLAVFLESAFASADRGMPLAVVLFDLDHFKEVNDRHGHNEGDRVLRAFGAILRDRTREMNLTGRWGGEEFLSVLNGSTAEGASVFAEHVRENLEETDFGWGRVTVSVGVAEYDRRMTNPEVLVAAADQALYRAKRNGRNRVEVAGPRKRAAAEAGRAKAPATEPAPAVDAGERGRTAVTPEVREVRSQGRSETILVVDDDRDARRSVSRVLSRHGYHVFQASGPEEALEIVRGREEPVDLVVTDVIMPEMSGFRLMEMLLTEIPDLRVVYISGYAQEDVDWEGTPGRVSRFLSKPMSVETLAETVHEVLERPVVETPPAPGTPAQSDGPGVAARDETRRSASPWERPGRAERLPRTLPELTESQLLVLDDDRDALRGLCLLLGSFGFKNIRGTTDPADLPIHLARLKPDLVLLDMQMPELDGFEVLSALQQFDRSAFLPVIAITGGDGPELHRRALAAGASDFVEKPVEAWELEARVRNLLRIRSMALRKALETRELEERVTARTAELAEARTEVLLRLARAAEYRDDVTGHHAERVGALAGLLAEQIGVDSDRRDLIQRAAPLHDVGKIGISDRILRKAGPLEEAEMEIMRDHTAIGARILAGSRVPLLQLAREIALTHHERWNGEGYPRGLSGEEIPLAGRIVAVADVFDSLTHDRPYRRALSEEETLAHLCEGAGSRYDPAVVDALLDLYREGKIADAKAVEIIAPSAGAPRDEGTGRRSDAADEGGPE